VSLDALRALPADTLGHAYSRHLEANRIAPLEPSWVVREETSDAGYVCARLRETHDVLHVITGYGTDALGELEIQLFNLGNLSWSPVPLLAVGAAWLGGWLGRYGGLHGVAGQLRAAYVRGRRTPPLAGVIWEDHWHEPLSRVRDLVALTPF
jgi:ubiquinone biosynthesis protein COQ4